MNHKVTVKTWRPGEDEAHRWECSCGRIGPAKWYEHLAKRGGDLHSEYFNGKRRK